MELPAAWQQADVRGHDGCVVGSARGARVGKWRPAAKVRRWQLPATCTVRHLMVGLQESSRHGSSRRRARPSVIYIKPLTPKRTANVRLQSKKDARYFCQRRREHAQDARDAQ